MSAEDLGWHSLHSHPYLERVLGDYSKPLPCIIGGAGRDCILEEDCTFELITVKLLPGLSFLLGREKTGVFDPMQFSEIFLTHSLK